MVQTQALDRGKGALFLFLLRRRTNRRVIARFIFLSILSQYSRRTPHYSALWKIFSQVTIKLKLHNK